MNNPNESVQQLSEAPARLSKLEEWLDATGRKRTWFARAIGYSYQALLQAVIVPISAEKHASWT